MRSLPLARAVALSALLVAAAPAPALTTYIVVNDLGDAHDDDLGDGKCETTVPNHCTLRAAMEILNAIQIQVGQYVVVVPAGTITLTLGELLATRNYTVAGAGRNATVISAGGASRVFNNDSGISSTLTLTGLTLRDGLTAGVGGAIRSVAPASLVLEDCLLVHDFAQSGGGIFANGSISLARCEITDCHATGAGGTGGALSIAPNLDASALAVLDRSTLHGNVAAGPGGAIYMQGGYGFVDLVNSTVSGNVAGGAGGGIRVEEATLNLDYVTVTDNISDLAGGGGGLSSGASAAAASFTYAIVAGNFANNGFNLLVDSDCTGAFTANSGNLVGVGTEGCSITGTKTIGDPQLGPLQSNGGATPTHALLLGSPAIDVGSCTGRGSSIATDQRGVARPIGGAGHCDLGAYERAPCGDVNGDGAVDVLDVFFLINFLFAGGPLPPGLANVNQDSVRDVLDVFYLINALFAGGPAPVCPGT
jgi:hypothetical protein